MTGGAGHERHDRRAEREDLPGGLQTELERVAAEHPENTESAWALPSRVYLARHLTARPDGSR